MDAGTGLVARERGTLKMKNKRYCVKIVGVDMEGKKHFCNIPFDCKPITKVMGGLLVNMATEVFCKDHSKEKATPAKE